MKDRKGKGGLNFFWVFYLLLLLLYIVVGRIDRGCEMGLYGWDGMGWDE